MIFSEEKSVTKANKTKKSLVFLTKLQNPELFENFKKTPSGFNSFRFIFTDADLRDNLSLSNLQRELLEDLKSSKSKANLEYTDYLAFDKIVSKRQQKKILLRAKFKGTLEISTKLKISVRIFTKTIKTSMPTMKNSSRLSMASENLPDNFSLLSHTVSNSRVFYEIEDIYLKEVAKAEVLRGYNFGNQKIPVTKDMESVLRYRCGKRFQVLCFLPSSAVPRHLAMSNCDVVLPDLEDLTHLRSFSALAQRLLAGDKYILGRLVARNNASPKLVILTPKCVDPAAGKYCFYSLSLPTSEDMRQFRFSSLLESNPVQRRVVRELVEKMSLGREALQPENNNMPALHSFDTETIRRAVQVNIEGQQLQAQTDPNRALQGLYAGSQLENVQEGNIREQVTMEFQTREQAQCLQESIVEAFGLLVNPGLEKVKPRFWADIIRENEERLQEEQIQQKIKDFNKDEVPDQISRNYAVTDFKLMVNYKGKDLVDKAIEQMKKVVSDMIVEGTDAVDLARALECVKALRAACIDQMETPQFNDFLRKIRAIAPSQKKFAQFLGALSENTIVLISKEEAKDSDASAHELEVFFRFGEDLEEEEGDKSDDEDLELLRMMDQLE